MNKVLLWFLLSCKRQLKRPVFLAMLFLIPLVMGALHRIDMKNHDKISIALYTENDTWNESVAKELKNRETSFSFYLCSSKEELERDVASRKAECGYCFPKGLYERLEKGEYKRSIITVKAPSTVMDKLVSEVVFAELFKIYGKQLLKNYADSGTIFDENRLGNKEDGAVWNELEPLYEEYLESGRTFSFEYETEAGGKIETNSVKAVFPVRGVAAVFIFVIGLASCITVCEDKKRGLLTGISSGQRMAVQLVQLFAPIILGCFCAYLCLIVTREIKNPLREIFMLLLYGICVTVFVYTLVELIGDPLIIAGLIPFFIIGSLTVCPVFLDLSAVLPVFKVLRLLFLPYYYLSW